MIGILTDSACDLPKEILNQYNIQVIPIKIKMGASQFSDGVNLSPDLFYRQLENPANKPETEPPSIDDFISLYRELLKSYDEIISIHVGSAFSKTVYNANEAVHLGHKSFFAERVKDKKYDPFKIRVIDSRNASIGLGLQVLRAAQMLQRGTAFNDLCDSVESVTDKVRLIFTPRDLTWLNRSGRLTGIKFVIASLVGLKPILMIQNGKSDRLDTVRGHDHAVQTLVDEAVKLTASASSWYLGVAWAAPVADRANNPVAKALSSSIRSSSGYFEATIGSTIGAHCGPETVGIALLA